MQIKYDGTSNSEHGETKRNWLFQLIYVALFPSASDLNMKEYLLSKYTNCTIKRNAHVKITIFLVHITITCTSVIS